jgi:hypothetical protein
MNKGGNMTSSELTQRSPGTARGRWSRLQIGLVAGLAAATMTPIAAHAQTDDTLSAPVEAGGDYVTTTLPQPSLDVSGLSPECIRDAPFIRYTVVPRGFTPTSTQATLEIRDRNGNLVETVVVNSFSGTIAWPGASTDANGNGTNWPGWKRADDGVSFIPDPSDSVLREGLNIKATVNASSATASVSYPATTSPCANPPESIAPNALVPSQSSTAETCVPGQNNDGNPADDCKPVCVPGQNNDRNPGDDCDLARTGGGPGNALILGAAALLAGVLFLTAARRRRNPDATPSPS